MHHIPDYTRAPEFTIVCSCGGRSNTLVEVGRDVTCPWCDKVFGQSRYKGAILKEGASYTPKYPAKSEEEEAAMHKNLDQVRDFQIGPDSDDIEQMLIDDILNQAAILIKVIKHSKHCDLAINISSVGLYNTLIRLIEHDEKLKRKSRFFTTILEP